MSKILEFFGLAKPENSQPPMAPPAPKDSQPPGLLGRPVESIRATPLPEPPFGQKPVAPPKSPQNQDQGLPTRPLQFPHSESNALSGGPPSGPKPRSRDRNPPLVAPPVSAPPANPPAPGQGRPTSFTLPFNPQQIRQDLADCGQKTFPSAFPAKPVYPDIFPNDLRVLPLDLKVVQRLAEDSAHSATTDNKIAKFYNIKKEVDFYKKYITMNDIKKQKLQQEVQDLRNMHMSYSNADLLQHPQFDHYQQELFINDKEIEEEQQEVERLRQIAASGGRMPQSSPPDWQEPERYPANPADNFFAFSQKPQTNNFNYMAPPSERFNPNPVGNNMILTHLDQPLYGMSGYEGNHDALFSQQPANISSIPRGSHFQSQPLNFSNQSNQPFSNRDILGSAQQIRPVPSARDNFLLNDVQTEPSFLVSNRAMAPGNGNYDFDPLAGFAEPGPPPGHGLAQAPIGFMKKQPSAQSRLNPLMRKI